MYKFEKENQAIEKYGELRLNYNVSSEPYYKKQNDNNYEAFKEVLFNVGIYLSIEEGQLSLSMNPEKYIRVKDRYSGKRKKRAVNRSDGRYETYNFSDIVFMKQTMTDAQLCEKIDMKPATYYRHKKELKESDYYKTLDKNKLSDLNYLKSIPGDFMF